MNEWMNEWVCVRPPLIETYREGAVCPSEACLSLILFIITHVDGSRVSIAIMRLCVSVCPHDKTKTACQTWHADSPSGYLANQWILGQRSRFGLELSPVSTSRVDGWTVSVIRQLGWWKRGFRVGRSSGRRELCTSIECFSSYFTDSYSGETGITWPVTRWTPVKEWVFN